MSVEHRGEPDACERPRHHESHSGLGLVGFALALALIAAIVAALAGH